MTMNFSQDTRLFVNHVGNCLSNEQEWARNGESFRVLEKRVMHYDHRDQLAVKVTTEFGDRWILVQEAGIVLDS